MARRYEVLFGWQEMISRLKVAIKWDIVLVARTQGSYLHRTYL